MKKYWVWEDSTCWVCQQIVGKPPSVKASSRGFNPTSPCCTSPVEFRAESRGDAIKEYRRWRRAS